MEPKIEHGVRIPDVTETNAWHMIGWLESRLQSKGRITKGDWNKAVELAQRPRP